MAENTSGELLVATTSFITEIDGKRITVTKGVTRVRAGHALAKGREHLFKPADAQFDVETGRQEPVAPRKGRGGAKPPAEGSEAPTGDKGGAQDPDAGKPPAADAGKPPAADAGDKGGEK